MKGGGKGYDSIKRQTFLIFAFKKIYITYYRMKPDISQLYFQLLLFLCVLCDTELLEL